MIPNRDLDALERWVLSAGGPQESLVSDALLRALAELRATRSQLAESQQENATLKRRLVAAMTSPEWTMVRCDVCGQIAPPHKHTVMAS